jgi:hypothetical protein
LGLDRSTNERKKRQNRKNDVVVLLLYIIVVSMIVLCDPPHLRDPSFPGGDCRSTLYPTSSWPFCWHFCLLWVGISVFSEHLSFLFVFPLFTHRRSFVGRTRTL